MRKSYSLFWKCGYHLEKPLTIFMLTLMNLFLLIKKKIRKKFDWYKNVPWKVRILFLLLWGGISLLSQNIKSRKSDLWPRTNDGSPAIDLGFIHLKRVVVTDVIIIKVIPCKPNILLHQAKLKIVSFNMQQTCAIGFTNKCASYAFRVVTIGHFSADESKCSQKFWTVLL